MHGPAGAVPADPAAPGLIRLRASPLSRGHTRREEKPHPHHNNPVLLPLSRAGLCVGWQEESWGDF